MIEHVIIQVARLCTWLGALALAIMMLATDYDILARQIASHPLDGVVELVEIMVLATVMLGLPEAFLRGEQITIDLVDRVLSSAVLKFVKFVALVLSIVFLLLLCIYVYSPLLDAHQFGDIKPDLGVKIWPLYALIIFSFGASILTCLVAMWRISHDSEVLG